MSSRAPLTIAVLLGVSALGMSFLLRLGAPLDAVPVPSAQRASYVLVVLFELALAVSFASDRRAAYVLVALLAPVVIFVTSNAFPLGPSYVESLALPADHGTAYLFHQPSRWGEPCRQRAYVAPPWSAWAHLAAEASCDEEGHLSWSREREVLHVVDERGGEIAPQYVPPPDFFPH